MPANNLDTFVCRYGRFIPLPNEPGSDAFSEPRPRFWPPLRPPPNVDTRDWDGVDVDVDDDETGVEAAGETAADDDAAAIAGRAGLCLDRLAADPPRPPLPPFPFPRPPLPPRPCAAFA